MIINVVIIFDGFARLYFSRYHKSAKTENNWVSLRLKWVMTKTTGVNIFIPSLKLDHIFLILDYIIDRKWRIFLLRTNLSFQSSRSTFVVENWITRKASQLCYRGTVDISSYLFCRHYIYKAKTEGTYPNIIFDYTHFEDMPLRKCVFKLRLIQRDNTELSCKICL